MVESETKCSDVLTAPALSPYQECKDHIRADMTMSRYGWSRLEDFGHALSAHCQDMHCERPLRALFNAERYEGPINCAGGI